MNARIYLDHAATTPVSDDVLAAMLPHFGAANPSSLHAEGRSARAALETARTTIARAIGAEAREIVFTSGGSEADQLAIAGAARAARALRGATHLVTVATEHHAVLHAVEALRDEGFAVTVLDVDRDGALDPAAFARALRPETSLATVMLANNEIGTLHPIAALAGVARERGVVFHTDAVQAPGHVPLDVDSLGIDLLSLSAHKCDGPKGVGALYVRAGTPLVPLAVGGPQEFGRRAGTENVAGAVGFARALAAAARRQPAEATRLGALRDRFETAMLAAIPDSCVNGAGAPRAPHVSNMAFARVFAAELLIRLDLAGFAISTGSACAAGASEPSHVIAALGAPEWALAGAVRFSLGSSTREQDVTALEKMLPEAVAAIRVASGELGIANNGPFTKSSEVRS